ncbi:hypothetical protein BGX24_008024 [Mortierella sp. AD032]|nr:hypothetical protein BGX24_008024 [Mortierella sp. AD032]
MTRELDELLNGVSRKRIRPKRSSTELDPQPETPNQEPPTKKVSFQDAVFSSGSGSDFIESNPSPASSSLNSVDFKYIDHLVGPGTTSSRLKTSSRLIVDKTYVSEVLMNARRNNLKKQSEITDVSALLPGLWKQVSSHPTPWQFLGQNEDTYTQSVVRNIILGIVGDLDVVDHWSRDPLPLPMGLRS